MLQRREPGVRERVETDLIRKMKGSAEVEDDGCES